mmetsp:Transcript_16539/g.49489  ORF Transcript_16539/g.49489 Transcript_16539/m.49489 type:complete len:357 (+) Transcript_16539:835-1905(+)
MHAAPGAAAAAGLGIAAAMKAASFGTAVHAATVAGRGLADAQVAAQKLEALVLLQCRGNGDLRVHVLVLHEGCDVVEGEGDGGVVVQQEAVGGRRVVVHHQLLHPSQHLVVDGLGVVAIVPVHGADAIQLLHAEDRAEVVGDLLQALLVLLVNHQEGDGLSDELELLPGVAHPLLAGAVDPGLHFCQPRFHVLPVGEAAALPPQQQLVEQLHVHEAEELLEQLLHQEGGHVVALQRFQQLVEHPQNVAPVRAQLHVRGSGLGGGPGAGGGGAAGAAGGGCAGRVDAGRQLGGDLLLHVVAQHGEDLLHERVQLLLEQQRRVLGFHLAETAGSPAMNGCDAVHCGCAPRRTPLPAEE